jgi:integrase
MQLDIAAGKSARPRAVGRGGITTGGRGVAACTIGMLGTILDLARRRRVISANPARGVNKLPEGKQRRYLSIDEIVQLGTAMRNAEREEIENRTGLSAIRFLLLTGLRRSEALALPWDWVDARARCIRFADTKSGAQLRPIGAPAVKFLEALPHAEGAHFVSPADRGAGHFIGLPRVLERICARAALAGGVTVHVLRHSFAAAAAEMDYSELTIAGLLGHSVPGITARYAHVPDRAPLAAADQVSARISAALAGEQSAAVLDFDQQRKTRSRPAAVH